MWKHWFLRAFPLSRTLSCPTLSLSNVGDLNNLGGKGEREEIAFALVQIVQGKTSVLHQTLQWVCHFQAFICYILNPYPLCVCTGGVCKATWLTIEKGANRHLVWRPHIIMTLFNSVANGCLCATNYWWRIIISPPIRLYHAEGFLLVSSFHLSWFVTLLARLAPRISVLAI